MLNQFREVWLVDFEFGSASTLRPEVVCLVAHELHSGRTIRLWRDEMGPIPPYDTGPDSLFIAFFASAEFDCHRALGWPMPARILDLYCEFRDRFNGLPTVAGSGLLGALAHGRWLDEPSDPNARQEFSSRLVCALHGGTRA